MMIGSPFTQSGLSFVSSSPKDDLPKSRLGSFLPLGASTVLFFFSSNAGSDGRDRGRGGYAPWNQGIDDETSHGATAGRWLRHSALG